MTTIEAFFKLHFIKPGCSLLGFEGNVYILTVMKSLLKISFTEYWFQSLHVCEKLSDQGKNTTVCLWRKERGGKKGTESHIACPEQTNEIL